MNLVLRRSSFEPDLFEVWEDNQVIREIPILFLIQKIPRSFESMEALLKWLKETEWKLVRMTALRLIAMRALPSVLLRRKLEAKRFSREPIERVIQEMQDNGYIQDEEWIRSAVLREFNKGYGPRVVEMRLRVKGVTTDLVRKLITSDMEKELILKLRVKLKLSGDRQKALRVLLRRGFDRQNICP